MGRVLVVAGPTASGKTALGIALAQHFGGEIVSADSMQIYKGMDVGTAKATPSERAAAVHHMIDVVSPSESYSVAAYVEAASECCDDILSRGVVPIIVGGTGLYIDSLLSGRSFGAAEEDESLRRSLGLEYEELGGDALLARLASVDPERASLLHPADKKRIIRALEVYYLTGETITEHDARTREIPPRYDSAFIIPGYRDRALLYARIDARVDEMVSHGLFEEVASLLASGLSPECTAMQAIGYKETALALRGEISREEAVDSIKLSSRRYAKRQLTWFNRRTDALRLYRDELSDSEFLSSAISFAEGFLT